MTDEVQESVVITEKTYPDSEIERAKGEIKGMTPEAYLSLESALNASQDVIPEAGGIAFTEFVGKHGGVIHVTARASHPTRANQMLLESLDYLRSLQPEVEWRIPDDKGYAPSAPVQQVQQPAEPVQSVQQPVDQVEPQYVDVQEAVNPPAQVVQQAGQQMEMDIVKVEISPKPDGRVDVGLFAVGHKWPDLKINNWPPQNVLELVDPALNWSLDTLATPKVLQGDIKARWEFSTKNFKQSGEPYKDVKLPT
jgi:hypothetical protein